jgi:hypothetical protein
MHVALQMCRGYRFPGQGSNDSISAIVDGFASGACIARNTPSAQVMGVRALIGVHQRAAA